MKQLFTLLIFICLTSLTACNAVHGAGEDIQKASDWTKSKLPK
jgi:predicted small secreted protein